jgi:hypothetical protein
MVFRAQSYKYNAKLADRFKFKGIFLSIWQLLKSQTDTHKICGTK